MKRRIVAGLLFAVAFCGLHAEEPAFTAKPSAAREGDTVKISFAVSKPTDVAVYIENAQGKVIRHLAAGVLGPNAPAPFKANALAQTLDWDGKANYGMPATGGPFTVRVGLGLQAKCDKIFNRPEVFSGNMTIAVGPDGSAYVQDTSYPAAGHFPHRVLVALNRDGSYRRMLLPFASTPDNAAARGLPAIMLEGRAAPAGRESECDLLPWMGGRAQATMAVSKDNRFLYVPICGGNPFRPAQIAALSTEGGGIAGHYALDKSKLGELPEFAERTHLVVSSDGQYLYMLGLRDRRKSGAPAAIFRVRLPDCSGLQVFFGEYYKPGKDATHLGAVEGGMAVDGKGNLLICDPANKRVIVVGEQDRTLKGEFPCDGAQGVGVHLSSGAVFVASESSKGALLQKFAGWQSPKQMAEVKIPRKGAGHDTLSMVVDGAGDHAVAWIAASRCGYLVRATDTGTSFEIAESGGPYENLPGNRHEMAYLGLAVDRQTQEVYVRNSGVGEYWERFNDETGTSEFVYVPGCYGGGGSGGQLVPGRDGILYSVKWRHKFAKYGRNGKPIVMEEPRKPTAEELKVYPEPVPPPGPAEEAFARVGMVEMPHTLGVRWSDGHLFVFEPHMITQGDGGRIPKALHEYLPTGKRTTSYESPIIWKVSDAAVGPKFDAAGNIYVAEAVRPKGWRYPDEWAQFIATKESANVPGIATRLPNMYGSILKFSPKGGMVHWDGVAPYTGEAKLDPSLKTAEADYATGSANMIGIKVTGAEWIHPGVGHVGFYGCNCENMTFEVDEFGRTFFPDTCLYKIRVIDTAGNAITTLGGYGNADNRGPESYVIDAKSGQPRPRRTDDPKDLTSPFATPDIAMAWPTGVGVTDKHLYVADSVNRRMVRAKWVYAAEERCAVK